MELRKWKGKDNVPQGKTRGRGSTCSGEGRDRAPAVSFVLRVLKAGNLVVVLWEGLNRILKSLMLMSKNEIPLPPDFIHS